MNAGIQQASRQAPASPLPTSWLGRADSPLPIADWAVIPALSETQHRNLLAQIAYVSSAWSYSRIGTANELGRYQFSTTLLEEYYFLTTGSNASYGTDCVNYQHCWRGAINSYANYQLDVTNLQDFLNKTSAQEDLAQQRLLDLYTQCTKINVIQGNDASDVVAGMLYVAWSLGVGSAPTFNNSTGTGAYAWRYSNIGNGAPYYNAGRYSVTVLSK